MQNTALIALGDLLVKTLPTHGTSLWKGIEAMKAFVTSNTLYKLGTSQQVRFWTTVGAMTDIRHVFPTVFIRATKENATVADSQLRLI